MMPKSTFFVTDPREIPLYPLRIRKRELMAKQSAFAEVSKERSDEERAELKQIVGQIASILDMPYMVECHGGDCKEVMDVSKDTNVLLHCNSVRIYDADTGETSW